MQFHEILTNYNWPVAPEGHHHGRHGWTQFDCPYCSPHSNKYRMGFNTRGGYVNCWLCGKKNTTEVIKMITGATWGTAKEIVSKFEKIQSERIRYTGKLVLPPYLEPLAPAHIKYLKGRGFDPAEVHRLWDAQGIQMSGPYKWRVFIPVYYLGELVSWTTRSIGDRNERRYISASEEQEKLPHKTLLYGEDYCRHAVIIHEGPLDVWKTGPGAVATMGTSITTPQIRKIANYRTRAICFDNEPEAQKRAKALCETLSIFEGETFNIVLDVKDSGEAPPEMISELREHVFGKER